MRYKRGAYDIGHYVLYFMLVALFLAFMLLSLKTQQGRHIVDIAQDEHTIQNLITLEKLTDVCFPYKDATTGRGYANTVDLKTFTDGHLKTCVDNAPMRVTLSNLEDRSEKTIYSGTAKQPTFTPGYTTIHYVYMNNQLALLTLEVV